MKINYLTNIRNFKYHLYNVGTPNSLDVGIINRHYLCSLNSIRIISKLLSFEVLMRMGLVKWRDDYEYLLVQFEIGNQVLSPIIIVQRNDDSKTLGKLWKVIDMFGVGRNQLLLSKKKLGEKL